MNINELVDNFSLFEDWEDRYAYLIDLGGRLPSMEEALKTDETKVQGCMSQVWMVLSRDENKRLHIVADSDAQIVKGLIAVLKVIYDGHTAEEAAEVDVEAVFSKLGLHQHLSVNRRNGFFAMVEKIQVFIGLGT
ncbi:MAG: SufE family protein [Alphaproteobacteria bacterium]|nr:SufE family protein [Alphaproteobacteria bacterium]